MLGILAIILASIWVLGLITSTTLGGFIHVLVVAAAVLLLIRFMRQPQKRAPQRKARSHARR